MTGRLAVSWTVPLQGMSLCLAGALVFGALHFSRFTLTLMNSGL